MKAPLTAKGFALKLMDLFVLRCRMFGYSVIFGENYRYEIP